MKAAASRATRWLSDDRAADTFPCMHPRLSTSIALLVCTMAVLCPVYCGPAYCGPSAGGTSCAHAAAHAHPSGAESGCMPHEHDQPDRPTPHCAHPCICQAGMPSGQSIQIPPLAPGPALLDDALCCDARLLDRQAIFPVAGRDPPECCAGRSAPLLI